MIKIEFPEFRKADPDKGFAVFMKYLFKTVVWSLATVGFFVFLFVKCGG